MCKHGIPVVIFFIISVDSDIPLLIQSFIVFVIVIYKLYSVVRK